MAEIKRTLYGREVTIQTQVLAWRKRMERYRELKKELARLFFECGVTDQELTRWLSTPTPDLGNKTPKQLVNPYNIARLVRYAKKTLR